jgi:uncharacterized membrane protein
MKEKQHNNDIVSRKNQEQKGEGGIVASFSGPLPPPNLLEGYERVLPGAADRIIAMAEQQMAHRQRVEHSIVQSNIRHERWGMIIAPILTIILMTIGGVLLWAGKDTAAYFAIFAPVVFHAGNYIYNKRIEKRIHGEEEKDDN